jgi:hypothetical protein
MIRKLFASLAATFALLLVTGCGPPTMESQTSHFKSNIDRLDSLAARRPQFKVSIDQKKVEYLAEFETLRNGVGEEGARALQGLNSRISRFINELDPQPVNQPGTQPGSKLDGPGVVAPGAVAPGAMPQGGAPVGGKLGGGAAPVPGGGVPVPAPSGGFGEGGAVPVQPQPVQPQPVQPVQPQGGSGFGGQ